MKSISFSVAMCVYGGDNAEHFRLAVDSILHQSVRPDEVVLVVDGPIPGELDDIVALYEKMPIFKIVRLEENQGHGVARRISVDNCTFDYIALMDADDISIYERFEKQLAFFKSGVVDIVGGDISEFIEEEPNIVGYRRLPTTDIEIKQCMKKRCPFNQVTVMFRKSAYFLAGGYLDWYCEEDYYLWLRMMQVGARFANTGDVLVNVRVGKEMYQRRGGWKYFKSEAKLQTYMLKNKVINVPTYITNVGKRLIVQVLLPNRLRGWVFQKFARRKV